MSFNLGFFNAVKCFFTVVVKSVVLDSYIEKAVGKDYIAIHGDPNSYILSPLLKPLVRLNVSVYDLDSVSDTFALLTNEGVYIYHKSELIKVMKGVNGDVVALSSRGVIVCGFGECDLVGFSGKVIWRHKYYDNPNFKQVKVIGDMVAVVTEYYDFLSNAFELDLLDLESGELINSTQGISKISICGKYLAELNEDENALEIVDLHGKRIVKLPYAQSFDFSPDCSKLALVSSQGLLIYDIHGKLLAKVRIKTFPSGVLWTKAGIIIYYSNTLKLFEMIPLNLEGLNEYQREYFGVCYFKTHNLERCLREASMLSVVTSIREAPPWQFGTVYITWRLINEEVTSVRLCGQQTLTLTLNGIPVSVSYEPSYTSVFEVSVSGKYAQSGGNAKGSAYITASLARDKLIMYTITLTKGRAYYLVKTVECSSNNLITKSLYGMKLLSSIELSLTGDAEISGTSVSGELIANVEYTTYTSLNAMGFKFNLLPVDIYISLGNNVTISVCTKLYYTKVSGITIGYGIISKEPVKICSWILGSVNSVLKWVESEIIGALERVLGG